MRTFVKISALAFCFPLVLGACGGSGSSEPAVIPASVDLEVGTKGGLLFDKTEYTATAGDIEIAYINYDTIRHNLIVVQGDTKVGTLELVVYEKGDLDIGTINLPAGNYVLVCSVPGHQNMKANLTVK